MRLYASLVLCVALLMVNASAAGRDLEHKKETDRDLQTSLIFQKATEDLLRKNNNLGRIRVKDRAIVFLSAILEYLTVELLQLAGNEVGGNKRAKIINADHIRIAITYDGDFSTLLGHVQLMSGKESLVTYIQKVLWLYHRFQNYDIEPMAMTYMNDLVNAMFERIATTAVGLTRNKNRTSVSYREIQESLQRLLGWRSQLAWNALSEATKAVNYIQIKHKSNY